MAPPADLLASPLCLVGDHMEVADRLAERRERWSCSYHVVPGDKAGAFAPIVTDLAGT